MNKQLSLFDVEGEREEKRRKISDSSSSWTLSQVKNRLKDLKQKGYISIPSEYYRVDEGVIGQILEREFNVNENNLSVRDLGTFELKGMRKKSKNLTLCHKTTSAGLNPIQVFDRFGYIRPSSRDNTILKKKLFSTINGKKTNHLKLILVPDSSTSFSMYYQPTSDESEFICGWDLEDSIDKIDRIILVLAETKGTTNSRNEQFHYCEAWLYNDLRELDFLIKSGIVVVDFCIDQEVGSRKRPHDRGPHIRIPKNKLKLAYREADKIL